MYEFVGLKEHDDNTWLPSVAMLFDGKLLESEIAGYQTLNVEGRETIGYNMDTSGNTSGRDGDITFGKNLPPRVLRIQYKLEVDDNEGFQHAFRQLNWLLETEGAVPIRFRDDPDIIYYGEVSNMDGVPPNSNRVTGTFEVYCSDPNKYTEATKRNGNPATIYLSSPYAVKPDEIRIVLGETATNITVDNVTTGRHIIMNGEYSAGDEIIIRLNESDQARKLTRNGQNIMRDLDYAETDFHAFLVKNKDVIQVSPLTATLMITARGRWK